MIPFNSEEFKETNAMRLDLPYLIAANIVMTAPGIKEKSTSSWNVLSKGSEQINIDGLVQKFTDAFIENLVPYATNIGWRPRGHIIYRTFVHKDMVCAQAALFISIGESVDEGTVVYDDRTVMGVMSDTWRAVEGAGDLHIAHIESYPHYNRDESGQPCAIPSQESFMLAQGWMWDENEFTCYDYSNDFIGWFYY